MSRVPLDRKTRAQVLQQPRCHLCGGYDLQIDGERWVVDHVQPKSRGGTDEISNLAKAHSTCNSWRSDRPITDELRLRIRRRRRIELFVQE